MARRRIGPEGLTCRDLVYERAAQLRHPAYRRPPWVDRRVLT
jgi:hypothetical protein